MAGNSNNIDKIKEILTKTKIVQKSITNEMTSSFMDYAMSVIISRAIPDVRDGLKPVHRRVLYSAYNMGMTAEKPYKKSARLVGEVIGKFHPHGDTAVYETIVRMAQNFSMRYLLVDGHGNFGSVDGDAAAAMRYTEARLSKAAAEMLKNIDKDTVNFVENYDGSEQEPSVLPGLFPNLLANGTTGIAVGMYTNIPPHNIEEIVDAVLFLAKNKDASINEIKNYLKGPDFPTGAEIVGSKGIDEYFETGKGSVTIRSKAEIVREKNNKSSIIITEIPYAIKKSDLIKKIVELVKTEAIEGIADLRDESSRAGIRIVIEIKQNNFPEVILNRLYRLTELQTNFNVTMLALVDNSPKLLNIKEVLQEYLKHQIDVLIRKTNFDLKKAQEKLHILEGLLIAQKHIAQVIKIIQTEDDDKIEATLMTKYELSKIQSRAILDMRLRSLSKLEKDKLAKDIAELKELISKLEKILASKEEQINIISEELTALKNKYKDSRKSIILYNTSSKIDDEDLIPVEDIVISKSSNNYLKRIPLETYKLQNRGGKGVKGISTYSDDEVEDILVTSTHTDILFFTDFGKVYRLRAHQIPLGSRIAKGVPAINLLGIAKEEKIVSLLAIDDYSKGYLFFATKNGVVKKIRASEFNSIKSNGKIAITLDDGDSLLRALTTRGKDEIFLGASNGLMTRFNEENVRPSGRQSRGVRGIRLDNLTNAKVVSASSSKEGDLMLCISEKGFGKLSEIEGYRLAKRGGKGVITLKESKKIGNLVFARAVNGDEDILIATSSGKIIRLSLNKLRIIGRNTFGVTLVKLDKKEKIISASVYIRQEGEFEEESEESNAMMDLN